MKKKTKKRVRQVHRKRGSFRVSSAHRPIVRKKSKKRIAKAKQRRPPRRTVARPGSKTKKPIRPAPRRKLPKRLRRRPVRRATLGHGRIHPRRRVYLRPLREKRPVRPVRAWVPVHRWLKGLARRYGPFEKAVFTDSRLKWFFPAKKFLWHARRWPPLSQKTVYVLLELWFVVYNSQEKKNTLWVRRMKIGREVTWRSMMGRRDQLIKRLGRTAVEVMSQSETLLLGATWHEVLKMINARIEKQSAYLEDMDASSSEYFQNRGFVAWTVYPSPLWAQRLKKFF